MKLFISILVVLFALNSQAQNDTLWNADYTIDVKPENWSVDPNGNLLYSKEDVLVLLDTSFKERFRSSNKGFGDVTTVDARHSQKILLFSFDQQQILFVDNTLSPVGEPIDLADQDIYLATHVSYSNLSNRYWIYDQDNFRIILNDDRNQKPTIIENLNGVLGETNVDQFFEANNQLYVVDLDKGVFIFDIYGSLVNTLKIESASYVTAKNNHVFVVQKDTIVRINLKTGEKKNILVPISGIQQIQIYGNYLFIQTETQLQKYSVNLK